MSEPIIVSESMLESLQATRPWVKFLAILGFIFAGFMIVGGLFMSLAFSFMPLMPGFSHFFGPVFGILYIVMAVFFYLLPCLYLLRYGSAITRIPESGQEAMEDALRQQKTFWKYLGIFAIVVLVLYVFFFIGGITAAIIIGAMHHA
jgi:hypothetical protein